MYYHKCNIYRINENWKVETNSITSTTLSRDVSTHDVIVFIGDVMCLRSNLSIIFSISQFDDTDKLTRRDQRKLYHHYCKAYLYSINTL